jgi:hypothetical protein
MLEILYPALASLSYGTLLCGFQFRARNKRIHALLMGLGMGLDLLLVLTLELTRHAIGTVLGGSLTGPEKIHVGTSTLAVILYFPIFVLGWRRLYYPSPENTGLIRWHRNLGYAALFFRSLGFIFMFSMLGRN